MKVIGFVAFRAGSKRLPKKNGRKLGNKTLYQIMIDKLVKSFIYIIIIGITY